LVDFLRRKKEGALLICGKRGVGKTSVIFSAIQEAKRLENGAESAMKILPVLVNAPGFGFAINKEKKENGENTDTNTNGDEHTRSSQFKRVVLQNVVRKLYTATTALNKEGKRIEDSKKTETTSRAVKNPLTDQSVENLSDYIGISYLFTKAVATEVRKVINLEELEKQSKIAEKEITINFNIEKLLGIGASFVAAAVIALAPIVEGVLNSIIALLTATVPSVVAMSWQYKKSTSLENKNEKTDSLYYRHDYDTNTLQSDLEDKLRQLADNNFKVVFVIDELDKVEQDEILETIKSLKTFFNQSLTLFVLIADDSFYNKMLNDIGKRPQEYTLFPQKIFLQRPLFSEMEEFIDKITNHEGEAMFKDDYRRFRNYLCYASKTDFFDLYNIIRDHIASYDDKGIPLLDIKLPDQKYVIQADLQKVMGQIYSRKKYGQPSDWHKNDLLLNQMYQLLDNLTKHKPSSKITIRKEPHLEINFPEGGENMIVKDTVEAGALEDLLYYLERLQFIQNKEGNVYEIIGKLDTVPANPIIQTQEEKVFLDEYKKLSDLLFAYANLYNKFNRFADRFDDEISLIKKFDEIGISSSSPSSPAHSKNILELVSIYHSIESRDGKSSNQKTPVVIEREKLERNTELAIEARKEYIDNFILLIKKILELKIPKDKLEIIPFRNLFEETQLPMPTYLSVDNPSYVALSINSNDFVIVQNFPLLLKRIIRIEGLDEEFGLLLTSNPKGDFTSPIRKSLSDQVTTFLNAFNEDLSNAVKIGNKDNQRASPILELEVPINQKLLYRILYNVIISTLRGLRKNFEDDLYEYPQMEETISSEDDYKNIEESSDHSSKLPLLSEQERVILDKKEQLYSDYWSILGALDEDPRDKEQARHILEEFRSALKNWFYAKQGGRLFASTKEIQDLYRRLLERTAVLDFGSPDASRADEKDVRDILYEIRRLAHDLNTSLEATVGSSSYR
jgi:hypothetical protein